MPGAGRTPPRWVEDPRIWSGLLVLRVPPFLYSWADRAEVVKALEQLREALVWVPPDHLAVRPMVEAARLIDGWLARWPAEPEQRAVDPGLRSWNEVVAPTLLETWRQIEPQAIGS